MDLRQLRYFKVLAEHQHFGRASALLHIAQPALTRQVQLLESELGVRLVERHSRGASLTREGDLLVDRATFLLRYTDQIKVDIMDLAGTARGPVALGLPPALAGVVVPPLARTLRARYPEVRLRVIERFSPALCEALEQGTIDVAVLSGPIAATPFIHVERLMTEPMCAIGPAQDDQLPPGPVSVHQLTGVPLILTGVQNSGVRLALERAAARANVELKGIIEVESATVATQLVEAGIGWTIHFASAVAREVNAGKLRAVPVEGLILERYIAYPAMRPPSVATVSLITLVCETAESLIESGQWPMAKMACTESSTN
ncbi:LysR family transcriptional regulator [Trinickia mobilis]|uniref:LysR family transcriptional regulator n=1 Tax=Trinickia mobilis TaxID=2816356 RepID=UPI001A8DDB04|nr:LysR substrate-binding domain-containing protein [Trinickia mobilis]